MCKNKKSKKCFMFYIEVNDRTSIIDDVIAQVKHLNIYGLYLF